MSTADGLRGDGVVAAPGDGIEITDEFARALGILHRGGHMFLTGRAGTGKSTLIRHFMARTDKNVVVAAPTGIAALNVNGYTLHKLFGFVTTTTPADIADGSYRPGRLAKVIKSLDTVIVDEASMVRADMFDMLAMALERFGPTPGVAFGGVQVVLVGDLLQLPPVVTEAEQHYFSSRYTTPYFFSADHFDREQFPTVALTRIFRQAGDTALTSILNALREGLLLRDAQRELNKRTHADFSPPRDEFWLTLAPTNRIVTARNRQRLDELPSDTIVSYATESGDLEKFERPAERELHFKIGAQIMMLANDPGERWANGTLGKVVDSSRDDADGEIATVTVQLNDGSIVEVARRTWDVTRPVVEGGALRHDVIGTFTQLPFKLAWAITIHKSQGQTVDRLIVDLTGGAFAFGQVYVAMSRCTSMDGLVLTRPVLTKDLKTDRRVLRYLRQATTTAAARRLCSLAVLTVGEEGRLARPRPVEIAVAFDDGTAISTLINPQRDLADARSAHGIATQDVLLAPTLAQAWAVLAPVVEGAAPVGFGTDSVLGLIDFELKRLGVVTPLPLGTDLSPARLTDEERSRLQSRHAMERARAALQTARRLTVSVDSSQAFEPLADDELAQGFLLTRDPTATVPQSASAPTLSALLRTSSAVSAVLLGNTPAQELLHTIGSDMNAAVASLIRSRLLEAMGRSARLPPELYKRIGDLEQCFGIDILDTAAGSGDGSEEVHPSIDEVLQPQTRVCFTGSVVDPEGHPVSKIELEGLVVDHGLRWATTVSKTRCDVLIVAELGTQSGKARKAKEYGKPMFSAAEFYSWISRR